MIWLYFIKAHNLDSQLRDSMLEKVDFQAQYHCPSLSKTFSYVVKADKASPEYMPIELSGAWTVYRLKNNQGTVMVPSSHEKFLYKWLCQTTPSTQILRENGQEIYFIPINGEYIIFSDTWSPIPMESFVAETRLCNILYPLYRTALEEYRQNPNHYLTSDAFRAVQIIP